MTWNPSEYQYDEGRRLCGSTREMQPYTIMTATEMPKASNLQEHGINRTEEAKLPLLYL